MATMRAFALYFALGIALAACDRGASRGSARQDTTTLPASAAADTLRRDSAAGGVPAVPSESTAATMPDTGMVLVHPDRPQRGGVIFALAQGLAAALPRCSWNGAPLPCYGSAGGILAVIPLPVDEPAGTYTLVIDRPGGGRITRPIVVDDREFGRELVFLSDSLYRRVRQGTSVARDARALRQILGAESPQPRWAGRWRDPVSGGRSSEYGVERFYYATSDSTRVVTLAPGLRSRGPFATDTSVPGSGDVPGWRHSGIDIAVPARTPVRAPAAGIVSDIGDYILSGRTLVIDHGRGVHSAYFHLDTVLVQKGDLVRAGATIGRVGRTGLATGAHLHYGIYLHGHAVDPTAWRDMPPFARGDSAAPVAAGAGARPSGSR